MNKVKLTTMGQIAATFTDKFNSASSSTFDRGAAFTSRAGPAPASVPSAATDTANDYHDWRDEED